MKTHILLVGLPGSGKTTVSQHLHSSGSFFHASDLAILERMADEAMDAQGNPCLDCANGISECSTSLHSCMTRWDEDRTLIVNDPAAWDIALVEGYRAAADEERLVYEFSRGPDEEYLAYTQVSEDELYERAFRLIRGVAPSTTRMLVAHLACSVEAAWIRNSSRRGHKLSATSFARSYARDLLDPPSIDLSISGLATSVLSGLPVLHLNAERLGAGVMAEEIRTWALTGKLS